LYRHRFVTIALAAWAAVTACIGHARGNAADTLAPYNQTLQSDLAGTRFVADIDDAAALYVNPAGLGARRHRTSILQLTYAYNRLAELPAAVSFPSLGLGYRYAKTERYTANSYSVGLGFPLGPGFFIGSSLNWHHTDLAESRSPFSVDLGFILRPHRYLSLGGVWRNANRPRFHTGRLEDAFTGGLSIRPMTERLTLSGQGTFDEGSKPGYLFGGRFSIVPGIELFGTYARDLAYAGTDPYEEFAAGVRFAFSTGRMAASTRSRVDGDYAYSRNTITFENTNAFFTDAVHHRPRYAEITLGGRYLDEGGAFVLRGGSNDLHGTLRELASIKSDPDVRGLLLKINPLEKGFIGPVTGNLSEIRRSIVAIRDAGKPVVAYLTEGGSAAELYIASAADRIVAPREAPIGMIGVSLEIRRLKRFFGKLGVDWDWYTAGEYKSSFHAYYTDTTTAVQQEALQSLVEESYRLLVDAIGEGRGIDDARMREIADGRVYMHADAVNLGLIDVVGWEDDARKELGALAGARAPDRFHTSPVGARRYWTERWRPAPAVAVVGAYGRIRPGGSKQDFFDGGRTMGSATVVRQLRAAAGHPGVRAIVLRVDSGGGSSLASNEILTEIRRIQREVGIPVVISMGDVAGSGGYWISMYGDEIFADPFTVTGSIGVVFYMPVLERLYDKIGVTNEVFKVGEHADALSPSRPMTEDERGYLADVIDDMYEYFIENVSKGRNIDPDEVRRIAGGRVYFGTQALDLGLVDRIGGLEDAIAHAAERAGIGDDYRAVYLPAFPCSFIERAGADRLIGLYRELMRRWPLGGGAFDETFAVSD
jgi:protease-4